MRIVDVRERTLSISRYADPTIPSGGLTTSIVAVVTDTIRDSRPVIGYGFASIGRFGQGGLIRERFAPRLLDATTLDDEHGLDPLRAWSAMMQGEKPGGHGERCVAVGTLDMAIWDAAAKIAELPLNQYIARRLGRSPPLAEVPVYAGGGYRYPLDDADRLSEEIRRFVDLGFTRAKIKIGGDSLDADLRRIEIAASRLGGAACLAVDAMNAYDPETALRAAAVLAPYALWWFEDICDPLDFQTQSRIAAAYAHPIAAGEALFSHAEARLLDDHAGLRRDRDILLFDPVHCYGLTHYCDIVAELTGRGWPSTAFWPHGGHLFGLHVVSGLGLGGAEISPFAFAPFRGWASGTTLRDGRLDVPRRSGIGFESHDATYRVFRELT